MRRSIRHSAICTLAIACSAGLATGLGPARIDAAIGVAQPVESDQTSGSDVMVLRLARLALEPPAQQDLQRRTALAYLMNRSAGAAEEPPVTMKRHNNNQPQLDVTTKGATLAQFMEALQQQYDNINYELDGPMKADAVMVPDMSLRAVQLPTLLQLMVERIDSRVRMENMQFSMRQMDNIYLFQVLTPPTQTQPGRFAPTAVEFIPIGPLLDAMGPAERRAENLTTLLSVIEEGLQPMAREPAPVIKLHDASTMLIVRGNQRQVQSAQSLVRALSAQAVARKEQDATGEAALRKLQDAAEMLNQQIIRVTMDGGKSPSESQASAVERLQWQLASLRRQIDTIYHLRLTRPLVLPGAGTSAAPPWWQSDPLGASPAGAPTSPSPNPSPNPK